MRRSGRSWTLDRIVSAVLMLDALRFDFQAHGDRRRWIERVAANSRLVAFTCARTLEDHSVIAQLVVSTPAAGMHALPTVRSAESEPDGLARLTLELDVAVHNTILRSMAATGPELQLRPGPRIRMPNGEVALDRYYAAAAERYGVAASSLRDGSMMSLA